MSRLLRRLYTTTSTPTAQEAAGQFLSRAALHPPQTHSQVLDATQLARLAATLSPHLTTPRLSPSGTPLPPAHHLVYFTPSQCTTTLSSDGTDNAYNPSSPFTRRMWAGGELIWQKENLLRVGQTVSETTQVLSAAGKRTKLGEEMIVVGVEKTFANERGVALLDRRSWIFRPEITAATPAAVIPRPAEVALPTVIDGVGGGEVFTKDFTQGPVTLFRFSALTFNAHRIHYDREWCREAEGHRDLVVHGPLNLVLMVDFWREVVAGTLAASGSESVDGSACNSADAGDWSGFDGSESLSHEEDMLVPSSIKYRATHPIYAGEKYRILLGREGEDRVSEVRIVDSFGNVCMRGSITR